MAWAVHPGIERRLGVTRASEDILGDGGVTVAQSAGAIPRQGTIGSGVREIAVTGHVGAVIAGGGGKLSLQ